MRCVSPSFAMAERQQRALDRDEAVAGLLGDLLGLVERARQRRRHLRLRGAPARHLGQLGERGIGPL